jgi:hypothetical protein
LGGLENEDWREASQQWKASYDPLAGDAVLVFCSPSVSLPFLYYARNERFLPTIMIWGYAESSYGTKFLLENPTAMGDDWDWHEIVPLEIWFWRRDATEKNRLPLPISSESAEALRDDFSKLSVVLSHCTVEARDALLLHVEALGWLPYGNHKFHGGELMSFQRDSGI